jgi:Mg-chelatase subunit ChlD
MLTALNQTSLIGSTTDTPAALSSGLTLFRTEGRSSAVQAMLLITDGHGAVDSSWPYYYYGNISLINSTTKIQRFGKEASSIGNEALI